jgi:hypothetical protein
MFCANAYGGAGDTVNVHMSARTVTGMTAVAGVRFARLSDKLILMEPTPAVLAVPEIVKTVEFEVTTSPSGAV